MRLASRGTRILIAGVPIRTLFFFFFFLLLLAFFILHALTRVADLRSLSAPMISIRRSQRKRFGASSVACGERKALFVRRVWHEG